MTVFDYFGTTPPDQRLVMDDVTYSWWGSTEGIDGVRAALLGGTLEFAVNGTWRCFPAPQGELKFGNPWHIAVDALGGSDNQLCKFTIVKGWPRPVPTFDEVDEMMTVFFQESAKQMSVYQRGGQGFVTFRDVS